MTNRMIVIIGYARTVSWIKSNYQGMENAKHISRPEHLNGLRDYDLFLAHGWDRIIPIGMERTLTYRAFMVYDAVEFDYLQPAWDLY